MADQKKFLDSAGVTLLWRRIKEHVTAEITEQTDPIVAEVEAAKKATTDLESYIGSIPSDYDEETVIAYIDKKAEETLDKASGNSSETAASVKNQLDQYKTENNAKVQANTEAISDNADDISAIQADYLTSTDKTELQNQINTIMNNPDTEGVINSINEFTQYIEDHGEIAEGFRTDINTLKNKVDTGDKTVSAYVAAEIAAANHASQDDVITLQAQVDTGDQTVTTYVTAQVNAAKTSANQYTDTAFGKIIALSQEEIDAAIGNA